MKVLFVYPNIVCTGGWNCFNTSPNHDTRYINHGIASIIGNMKKHGIEVELCDFRRLTGWGEYETRLQRKDFDFIAISYLSPDYEVGIDAINRAKRIAPDVPVIAGGLHISVTDGADVPMADYIVIGEGEEVMVDIVNGLKNKGIVRATPVKNLDSLPFPDRESFGVTSEFSLPIFHSMPPPHTTFVIGRGCPKKCLFCVDRSKIYGVGVRYHSPEYVISEMDMMKAKFGIQSYMIHDDIVCNPQWAYEFARMVREHGLIMPFFAQMRADFICRYPDLIEELKSIGMTWVSIGFESGSQRMLDFLMKDTTVEENLEAAQIMKRNKVNIFANYILGGFPGETQEDVKATAEMMITIRPERHSRSTYTLFPGSKLYDYCKENNLITTEKWGNHSPWEIKVKGVDYDLLWKYGAYIDERCRA